MATASDTIKLALRKLRRLGQGESPESAAQTDALTELNNILDEYLGFGSSFPWVTTYVDSSMTVDTDYPAQRLLCRHDGAITITLPEGTSEYPIADGFRVGIVDVSANAATYNITVARNEWLIEGSGANATISTSGANRIYMFRADLGDWKQAADLGANDSLPFPAEFDAPVALLLADRLSGEYGAQLSPRDQYAAIEAKQKLMARYVKVLPTILGTDVSSIGSRMRLPSDYGRRWNT